MRSRKGLKPNYIGVITVAAVLAGMAILQLTGTIDFAWSPQNSCPEMEGQVLCGICNLDKKLSDNPYAGDCVYCPIGRRCVGDVCGEMQCLPEEGEEPGPGPGPGGDLSGRWVGVVKEYLHGPEGSYPVGCNIEQTIEFNFLQTGAGLGGTMSTTITKVNGCDPVLPQSMVGFSSTAQLSGSSGASGAAFSYHDYVNLGAANFTATVLENTMTGSLVTCHSPDTRCTCLAPDARCPGGYDKNGMLLPGHLETVNWWTGEFTATRVG